MADSVPLPRKDPRTMQSMIDALLAQSHKPTGVPLPRPDPRSWTQRALGGIGGDESNSMGAIHPDALMKARGFDSGGQTIDQGSVYPENPMGVPTSQFPLGIRQPIESRGAGLFGVPSQHLQQMAATKPPDQNLPKLPQSGFVPSLSPMYMNDKGLGAPPAPNLPPIFWQPG